MTQPMARRSCHCHHLVQHDRSSAEGRWWYQQPDLLAIDLQQSLPAVIPGIECGRLDRRLVVRATGEPAASRQVRSGTMSANQRLSLTELQVTLEGEPTVDPDSSKAEVSRLGRRTYTVSVAEAGQPAFGSTTV
jgi:hypothetical protein